MWIIEHASGAAIDEIVTLAHTHGIVFQWVPRFRLEQLSSGNPGHQGVVARVSAYRFSTFDEVFGHDQPNPVLVLDGIEDPHNVGAIARSAAFFGIGVMILPRWRSAGVTTAAVKASAGAIDKVRMIQGSSSAQTVFDLKAKGYWIVGADMTGRSLTEYSFPSPVALVIGAEGDGLHRLVKERCDDLVRIPGSGQFESLNASVAAGILMNRFFQTRSPGTGDIPR